MAVEEIDYALLDYIKAELLELKLLYKEKGMLAQVTAASMIIVLTNIYDHIQSDIYLDLTCDDNKKEK